MNQISITLNIHQLIQHSYTKTINNATARNEQPFGATGSPNIEHCPLSTDTGNCERFVPFITREAQRRKAKENRSKPHTHNAQREARSDSRLLADCMPYSRA